MTGTSGAVEPPAPESQSGSFLSRVPLWARIAAPIVVVAIVAVIILAAIPKSFTANGEILITDKEAGTYVIDKTNQNECAGAGTSRYFKAGAPLVVRDPTGAIVAKGTVRAGRLAVGGTYCILKFSIAGVPPGKAFYKVDYAGRGSLKYSPKEMHTSVEMLINQQ